jgi:tryptophan synthase beta chain
MKYIIPIREFQDSVYSHPPSKEGRFGEFGGRFVPETLIYALEELTEAFESFIKKRGSVGEYFSLLTTFAGRPTPITYARNLSKEVGAEVFLKREDLAFTGAHKINNTLGQGLLTLHMGKKRVIAETGAGQHGVAVATAASLLKLKCTVFMGEEDVKRQALNVFRMKILKAEVVPVLSGTRTLKDATNSALRAWVTWVRDTHYILGSAVGPHPFPWIVRSFQSVIGLECKKQMEDLKKKPDIVVACVGGGSNGIGIFHPYRDDDVELIGVEALGEGEEGRHGASLTLGKKGILHGSHSLVLTTSTGQIQPAHSISAGLDYPGVGPELAYLKQTGRLKTIGVTDEEALSAFLRLTELEGIIPALESAHGIAWLFRRSWGGGKPVILVNLSGRGDKDVETVYKILSRKKEDEPPPQAI